MLKAILGVSAASFVAVLVVGGHTPTAVPTPVTTATIPTPLLAVPTVAEISDAERKKNDGALIEGLPAAERADAQYCMQHPDGPSLVEYDQAEQAAEIAIKAGARDPSSVVFGYAQFAGLEHASCGAIKYVCGKVNGKNGFGGYTGLQRYVLTVSGPRKGDLKVGVSPQEENRRCPGAKAGDNLD